MASEWRQQNLSGDRFNKGKKRTIDSLDNIISNKAQSGAGIKNRSILLSIVCAPINGIALRRDLPKSLGTGYVILSFYGYQTTVINVDSLVHWGISQRFSCHTSVDIPKGIKSRFISSSKLDGEHRLCQGSVSSYRLIS